MSALLNSGKVLVTKSSYWVCVSTAGFVRGTPSFALFCERSCEKLQDFHHGKRYTRATHPHKKMFTTNSTQVQLSRWTALNKVTVNDGQPGKASKIASGSRHCPASILQYGAISSNQTIKSVSMFLSSRRSLAASSHLNKRGVVTGRNSLVIAVDRWCVWTSSNDLGEDTEISCSDTDGERRCSA